MNTSRTRARIGVTLIGFFCLWSVAQAKVIYVTKTGNDANNGLSWSKAKVTVQAGLNTAVAGDEVWVAAGTYVKCVTLKEGASLYGGFAGNETQLAQRNWTVNQTILDGNAAGSVVTSPSGATSSTRIDGFTIRNGKPPSSSGGGIYCSSSSPTITNNTITGNSGSGIYCSSSSPTIVNNTITANDAGGIYCDSSSATITNNTITGHTTSAGIGIACSSSSLKIADNTITMNSGGGIYCYGGSPTITNNRIAANTARPLGGIYCSYSSSVMIAFNAITDHTAAGINCLSIGSGTITGNTILRNTIGVSGGGISVSRSKSLTITNNIIAENGAADGGGIGGNADAMTIANNTIVGNNAFRGGGVASNSVSVTMSNNIIAFNSSGVFANDHTPSVRSCCVYGNLLYNYSGMTEPTGSNGNISVDPGLANLPYGNLHLRPDSPCLNAGDDTAVQSGWTDIDGQARIFGTHVDIGADESDKTVWPAGPAVIVRVAPEGNDANDGSSWALPKKTVQAAIDRASVSGGDVWVKTGTYAEVITLRSYVHVYGGFSGTETKREQRNWRARASTLTRQSQDPGVKAEAIGRLMSTIDGFTILGTTASAGAGIVCYFASPTITNNAITGNRGSYGGGVHCMWAYPMVIGNAIFGNSATYGGGIDCESSCPAIINNTITGNSTSSGGAIHSDGSAIIMNTIVAFNSSGVAIVRSDSSSLRFNCVYGNTAYNYSGLTDPTGTDGNISADPRFVLLPTPGGDGQWGTADDNLGNLHLKARSCCIDAGDKATLSTLLLIVPDGFLRFFDDPATPDTGLGTAPIVDMGAYEYIPGDLDRDEDIDGDDLKIFTACASGMFIPYTGDCAGADFDKDGDVDLTDFGFIQRCLSGARQ